MILSLSSLIHLVSREKPDVAADYAVLLLTIVSAALHIVVGDGAGCLLHARRKLADAETYAHSVTHGSIFIQLLEVKLVLSSVDVDFLFGVKKSFANNEMVRRLSMNDL